MKRRIFVIISVLIMTLLLAGCNLLPSNKNELDKELEKEEAYQIYKLAANAGYEGTYEEWLRTIKGEKGDTGVGIASIIRTGTMGLIDTYTITFTDGTKTTFTITNGVNGETGTQGPKGDTGTQGDKGETGEKGEKGDAGKNGKSAYEIYKEAHPEYTKTETEWLDDLVNGRLVTKEEVKYTVTFDSKGGTQIPNQEVIELHAVVKPDDPVKEGCDFEGWYIDDEKWSFNGYVVTKDITLVAQWTPIVYTITYHIDDEINNYSNPQTYTIFDDINFASPKREGYTFYGWYLEDTFDNQKESIELGSMGNIDLYAKWICHVNYTIDNDEVIITSYNTNSNANEVEILDEYEGKPVVAVADYAFYGEPLTSITIPDSVKSIGNHAFQATSITTLDLNKVETIGDYAFFGCEELNTVDAGDELISTGSYAFANGSVTSIVFPNTFESLGSRAFDMNGGTRKYGINVQVEFNSEVKFVGGSIFSGVVGLIFMPETDKSNWESGWDFNAKVIEGTCDKVVYTNNGFSYCLTTTSTGSSAIVIDYQYDGSIVDLVIPATIDNAKVILTVGLYIGGSNVKTITFENGIEELPGTVLQDWMTLDSLVLPNTLKRICWNSISNLTVNELIIPSSVETIESFAFMGDTINKIYIPSTVAKIGYEGFSRCASSRIYTEASNKPVEWDDNWYGISNINDCWGVSYADFLTK